MFAAAESYYIKNVPSPEKKKQKNLDNYLEKFVQCIVVVSKKIMYQMVTK